MFAFGSVELEIERIQTNLDIERSNLKSIKKSLVGVFIIEMNVVLDAVLFN